MTQETEGQPVQFNNGLTDEQDDEVDAIRIAINTIIRSIDQLPRHRSLSLAITNLEQAGLWLRDRKSKPA